MTKQTVVASTEFQNRPGLYIERSGKTPVFITKHRRPVRVLIDIEEYERLKARDTRHPLFAHELPDEAIEALERATFDHLDPRFDDLSESQG